MRAAVTSVVIFLGLVVAAWPRPGLTQSERDFVFTDEDGHLVIRFVGIGSAGLSESQTYEISNAEFSSMVHDRLHADLRFEDEPRDPDWASWMVTQIETHAAQAGPEFSGLFIECRAASCRVIMEQPRHLNVTDHHAVLETVQESLQQFIASRRQHFEQEFMITAYDQAFTTPHIKAFLQRSTPVSVHSEPGADD